MTSLGRLTCLVSGRLSAPGLAPPSPCGAHLPAGWLRLMRVVASGSEHSEQRSLCC